jgi:hypothetical protein
MRKLLPFVVTALFSTALSAAFTLWCFLRAGSSADIASIVAEVAGRRAEANADAIDKLMFTKAGDFRFPDLTNGYRCSPSEGAAVAAFVYAPAAYNLPCKRR